MRAYVGIIAIALAGACGRSPSRVGTAPADDPETWQKIERLAAPREPGGDGSLLTNALAVAAAHLDAWRDRVSSDDSRGSGPASHAAIAVEARDVLDMLTAWAEEDGGLPYPCGQPLNAYSLAVMQLFSLASLTLELSTSTEPGLLQVATKVGRRMTLASCSLLDALIGIALLDKARRRARELEVSVEIPTLTDLDAVRVLTADARTMHASATFVGSPEGRAETRDALETARGQGPPLGSVDEVVAKAVRGADTLARIWRGLDTTSSRAELETAYRAVDEGRSARMLFEAIDGLNEVGSLP